MTGMRQGGCTILDVLGIGTPSLTLNVGTRCPARNSFSPPCCCASTGPVKEMEPGKSPLPVQFLQSL